jgi:hypothetical protein
MLSQREYRIGKIDTARITKTVGSTRKYGVKPFPKSKRSRRLGLFLETSTACACVAICTYPFYAAIHSEKACEHVCHMHLAPSLQATSQWIQTQPTSLRRSCYTEKYLYRYPISNYTLHYTICSRCPTNPTVKHLTLSQHILDSGWQRCSLFTDLSNPTSNSIYQQLGYRPVRDFNDYDFSR